MKKIAAAFVLLLAASTAQAQQSNRQQAMQEALRHSIKEKWRTPVPISIESEAAAKTATKPEEGRISFNSRATEEGEVSFAIHPADSSKLVLSFMEQNSNGLTFPVYYSSDAGQSWTRSSFNSRSILAQDHAGQLIAGGGDPVFAWDKNGRVYFSWIYMSVNAAQDSAYWSLSYAYSDNNGQSWTVPSGMDRYIGYGILDATASAPFNIGDGITDRQWFAVDNSGGPNQGKLYCSFLQFPADNDPAKFGQAIKVKSYNSTAFGPANMAFVGTAQFGNVEVTPNGTLHLSFADLDQQEIKHISSTNAAASFSTPHLIGSGNNFFGQTGLVHDRENAATNMAVDGAGNLHVVWGDFPSGGTSWQAFYSRSTNGGTSWSTPLNLSNSFSGRTPFMPTVAAFGNAVTISMAAIDGNDSSSFYQIHSTNNGATWGTPDLVSVSQTNYKSYTQGEFFGDYNRSLRTTCMSYAAWSDGRNNSGPKVFFTRTNTCSALGVGEVSTINGKLQLEALYPNPATTQLSLRLKVTQAGSFSATLTDISGKQVWNTQKTYNTGLTEISLSIGKLPAGSYLLSIIDTEGSKISRQVSIQ